MVAAEGRPTTAGGLPAFPRTDVPSETTTALDVPRAADSYAPVLGRQLGRSGQTSRSTTTGAWSEAPLPLRSSRST